MRYEIVAFTLAVTFALSSGCEQKLPETVDDPSTTNATETEIYEDPNVINSDPPEAEGDPDDLEEK
jgi:hypothetical protein